eukprot:143521_1
MATYLNTLSPTSSEFHSTFSHSNFSTEVSINNANTLFNISLSDNMLITVIGLGSVDLIIFIWCIYYIFTELIKRAKEPNNTSLCDTINQFRFIDYIIIILEIFNIITDYIFVVYLLMDTSSEIRIFALSWLALIVSILGVILFVFKYILLNKILGVQIKQYQLALSHARDDIKQQKMITEIRIRRFDIDVISLFNSSIEDIPLILIILIHINEFGFDYISIVTLSMSILVCLIKLHTMCMTKLGCNVEDILEETAPDLKRHHTSVVEHQYDANNNNIL